MNIFKKPFGKKTEQKQETTDLSMLENHFVLNVGKSALRLLLAGDHQLRQA